MVAYLVKCGVLLGCRSWNEFLMSQKLRPDLLYKDKWKRSVHLNYRGLPSQSVGEIIFLNLKETLIKCGMA